MTDANVGGAVRKIGYIDLMKIADPNNKKLQGGGDGFYDMPFNTIENVDVVDATHIIVADDNNLPFSAGRALDKADDNEFVVLEVGELPRREVARDAKAGALAARCSREAGRAARRRPCRW